MNSHVVHVRMLTEGVGRIFVNTKMEAVEFVDGIARVSRRVFNEMVEYGLPVEEIHHEEETAETKAEADGSSVAEAGEAAATAAVKVAEDFQKSLDGATSDPQTPAPASDASQTPETPSTSETTPKAKPPKK